MEIRVALLALAGVFTLLLGVAHFVLPALLDYRMVVLGPARERKPPRAFRLWPTRYVVTMGDRLGVIWVMNHAASYALVSIGVVDLVGGRWLLTDPAGRVLALWIAGWWLVRAASQRYLGRRVGDWLFVAWFVLLGVLHLWAAMR